MSMDGMEHQQLIRKYNVPGPRYTSYPAVPFWNQERFSVSKWERAIEETFSRTDEISLYIHLPYCESLCTFCGCNTRITVNHAVEKPYINAVLREWHIYLSKMKFKPVIREIHLGGGTPTFFSPHELKRLVEGIKASAIVHPSAEMGFEGHPNNTTEEHLRVLYNLGFRRVSFGIQDFDARVQQAINRRQSFEAVKSVTEIARTIGYTSINYDVLYGLPFQTMASIADTIEKVKLLRPDRIAFYSYAHIPWVKPGQRKFTEYDLPDGEVKLALYEYGKEKFQNAGYLEIGMDHFALPSDALYQATVNKSVHRNFMGYTTQTTSALIGLGVSSIGEINGLYAQNVKTVEEYIDHVTNKRLPVFRGHVPSQDDRVMRKHILNLMCRQETSWMNEGEACMALFNGLQTIGALEEEGLVETDYHSLRITEKGKPFMRNVCMALDPYLSAQTQNKVQFSKVI